jgi:CheY-like chemotaxis protein
MTTAIDIAESCAAEIAKQMNVVVDIAASRKSALTLLGRREYSIVIVDHTLAEADPEGADLIWKHSGLAIPLQINFVISNATRVIRDMRAALGRRQQEQTLAMRAAAAAIDSELKDAVTGFLLQSQLALAEPSIPPQLVEKLQRMAELAGNLRQRLEALPS